MKHNFNKLALALVASAFGHAALAASAEATTTATVVDNLTITAVNDLDFGTVAKLGAAQTKVIAPANGATFTVTGDAGFPYTVVTDASNLTGNGTAMTVDNVVVEGNDALSAGSDTLLVGATLNVGAEQAAGTYTGTLDVTVAYTGAPAEAEDGPLPVGPGDIPPFPPTGP